MYKNRWLQKANKKMEAKGTKGSFTAYAKRKGMGVQEAASSVLANENAPGYLKKRANFAKNAAKASRG